MVKKYKKPRPPRLYSDAKGRYIKLKDKKIYIKSHINNKNLVKVIVNNFSKKIKKKKRKEGKLEKTSEFADLEELNKKKSGLSSTAKTSPDLAKLMLYLTLNKKEEDKQRKALTQEDSDLVKGQKELLDVKNQQLEHYRKFYKTLPPSFDGPGGRSYIQPQLTGIVGETLTKKEQQARQATDKSEESQKHAEESNRRAELEKKKRIEEQLLAKQKDNEIRAEKERSAKIN